MASRDGSPEPPAYVEENETGQHTPTGEPSPASALSKESATSPAESPGVHVQTVADSMHAPRNSGKVRDLLPDHLNIIITYL